MVAQADLFADGARGGVGNSSAAFGLDTLVFPKAVCAGASRRGRISLRAIRRLPPPSMQERAAAAEAARALRAVIADACAMGAQATMHVIYARPRRGVWITTWENLPGFTREGSAYTHACLPGWQYARSEIVPEMIPDLEALAERGVRPSEVTAQ